MATINPRNIYIVGAQSTGKTTIVKALQKHFDEINNIQCTSNKVKRPKIIIEVARSVLREHKFTAEDITSSPSRALALQRLILKAQCVTEQAALKDNDWFISDRSGVDPVVYARRYVGEEAAAGLRESVEWLDIKERMQTSLIVVCEPGKWLLDDGVRLMPGSVEDWTDLHQLFCNALKEWGLTYEILPGT